MQKAAFTDISLSSFQCLHEDDRLILVKHNLIGILYLHFCICTNTQTEIFHEPNTATDFSYHATELRSYSNAVYENAMDLARSVQSSTANDDLVIKLMILIMILSKGADSNEPSLLEGEKVYRAQNIFVNLLWNYLAVKFGTDSAVSIVSRLVFDSLKAFTLGRESKIILATKKVQVDVLAPLMQSVLQISPWIIVRLRLSSVLLIFLCWIHDQRKSIEKQTNPLSVCVDSEKIMCSACQTLWITGNRMTLMQRDETELSWIIQLGQVVAAFLWGIRSTDDDNIFTLELQIILVNSSLIYISW